MGKIVKLVMMAGGLAVALAGVTHLRGWVDANSTVPTRIAPSAAESGPVRKKGAPRVSEQPTILQAKPFDARRDDASPPYRDGTVGGSFQPRSEPEVLPIVPAIPFPAKEGATISSPPEYSTENRAARTHYSIPNVDEARRHVGRPESPILNSLSGESAAGEGTTHAMPNVLSSDLARSARELSSAEPVMGWPFERESERDGEAESEQESGREIWRTRDSDSLWDISVARYGRGDYYRALFAVNRTRIHRPDRLPAGLLLQTPDVETLRQRYPDLCPAADSAQP